MRRLAPLLLVCLVLIPTAAGEEKPSPETEARSLLSEDVKTSWNAARALVERPGSDNTEVRKALATLVEEAGLAVAMPRLLRRHERGPLLDRIRQAVLLARLKRREIAVPDGMIAIPGGLAPKPLTGEEILVQDFFLDRLETDRESFARFLKESGHRARGEDFLKGWRDGKFPAGTGALPVTHVARTDAAAFAARRHARLPTAEELALARGGCARTAYPWGRAPKPGLANVLDGQGSGRPEGVEGRPDGASALGVLRLAGNVAEWTSSPWGASAETGVSFGETFLTMPAFRRSVVRKTAADARRRDLGFRCAASVPGR